ncbi:MAG: helix-turn-helix transcriptional regulator [Clostridia bacterium]|nr:helix-turn-helix transcriptional regulator [Clostridia bacterium]
MEKKTLGSFISALRRAQGLTQQEVADRLMVSNRAVSR